MGGRRDHALDDWVRATARRALAYARSLLHDPHRAEDVVQDCYARLLARADVYDLPRDGLKLLMRSITNACINLRTRARPVLSLTAGDDDGPAPEPVDRATDGRPDEVVMGRELEEAVGRGLAALPASQRAALELKSLGHDNDEIAEALGVSANNAAVLVYRARRALANALEPFLGREATG
jgi:RNA polymerase sigma factor (sigma-70 family)